MNKSSTLSLSSASWNSFSRLASTSCSLAILFFLNTSFSCLVWSSSTANRFSNCDWRIRWLIRASSRLNSSKASLAFNWSTSTFLRLFSLSLRACESSWRRFLIFKMYSSFELGLTKFIGSSWFWDSFMSSNPLLSSKSTIVKSLDNKIIVFSLK